MLVRNFSYFFIANITTQAFAFLTLPILSRYLSPTDYGIIAIFTMVGPITISFISLGLKTASFKYYVDYLDNASEFKKINTTNIIALFFLFSVGGYIFFLLKDYIASVIFLDKVSPILIFKSYIYGCVEYFFLYFTLLLTVQKRAKSFCYITIFRTILDFSITIYLVIYHNLKYEAKIQGFLYSYLICLTFLLIFNRHLLSPHFSFKYLKKSLTLTAPSILPGLVGTLQGSFDKMYLGRTKEMAGVGNYSMGGKFAGIFSLFHLTIQKIWSPYLLEEASKKSEKGFNNIVEKFEVVLFILSLAALSIIYFSEELFIVFVAPEFFPSIYLTAPIVFTMVVGILSDIFFYQIILGEKLFFQFPISIFTVAINITLNLILIPPYGGLGAVAAGLLSGACTDILYGFAGQKAFPLPIKYKKIILSYLHLLLYCILIYVFLTIQLHWSYKILFKLATIALYIKTAHLLKIFPPEIIFKLKSLIKKKA